MKSKCKSIYTIWNQNNAPIQIINEIPRENANDSNHGQYFPMFHQQNFQTFTFGINGERLSSNFNFAYINANYITNNN